MVLASTQLLRERRAGKPVSPEAVDLIFNAHGKQLSSVAVKRAMMPPRRKKESFPPSPRPAQPGFSR